MPNFRTMSNDVRVRYLLCLIGFLFSLKPSEPFLTNYLISDEIGLTEEEVDDEVYPVWTYASLAFLLPAAILTHVGSPRVVHGVVLTGFIARLATRILLIWTSSLFCMQLMQVTFGLATACEPAFYALIYERLSVDEFQRFTGFSRGAVLAGHLIAGLVGQAMVSSGVDLRILFYISGFNVALSTIIFICLPWSKESDDVTSSSSSSLPPSSLSPSSSPDSTSVELRVQSPESPTSDEHDLAVHPINNPLLVSAPAGDSGGLIDLIRPSSWKSTVLDLYQEYRRPSVFIFSLWWWLGNGVLELVLNYNTVLFYERDPDIDYNGAVTASGRGAAAVASILPDIIFRFLSQPSLSLSASLMVLISFDSIGAILLFLSALLTSVYAAYVLFILFYAFLQFVCSLASASIAARSGTTQTVDNKKRSLLPLFHRPLLICVSFFPFLLSSITSRTRTALIFTCNSFISLVFQSVTQTIIGHHGLHFKGAAKFMCFGWQLAGLSIIFATLAIIRKCVAKRYHQINFEETLIPSSPKSSPENES